MTVAWGNISLSYESTCHSITYHPLTSTPVGISGALPGIAFRNVNEGYTESAGVINQYFEGLYIMGGDVDVDKFL